LTQYRGRFAPSPTGPLHFGSLISAVGSYLQARSQHGEWWLRMEDIDEPRSVAGAADAILRTLELYGFEWDGELWVQSQRKDIYATVCDTLQVAEHIFPCACTRKQIIAQAQQLGLPKGKYPGTCRAGLQAGQSPRTLRLKVSDKTFGFTDQIQGWQQQNLSQDVGDFIIRRADGLFAYQLVVVVDDAKAGITEIVRGSDLLDSTPRQLYLQQLLGYPQPTYVHLPVALDARGNKLSKQTFATPIDPQQPIINIWKALKFLGQKPPVELQQEELQNLWQWAIAHWNLDHVPKQLGITMPALFEA